MAARTTPTSTTFITRSTADVFIPEIWSMSSLIERESALVFGPLFDRSLQKELPYGKLIYRPSISNLTAQSASAGADFGTGTSAGTADIVFEQITESQTGGGGVGASHNGITLTVNQHDYIALGVTSVAKLQTDREQFNMYNQKMSYSLAQRYDTHLAEFVDMFSQTVGTLATSLTSNNVIRGIQYLDDADAPMDDRAFIISPAQGAGFWTYDDTSSGDTAQLNLNRSRASLDLFLNRDYQSIQGKVDQHPGLGKAYIGSWQGVPFYRSTNVEGTNAAGHDNGLFHKMAVATVMQMYPSTHQHYDIDRLTDKAVMEQVYGSIEQWDNHGVWMQGA